MHAQTALLESQIEEGRNQQENQGRELGKGEMHDQQQNAGFQYPGQGFFDKRLAPTGIPQLAQGIANQDAEAVGNQQHEDKINRLGGRDIAAPHQVGRQDGGGNQGWQQTNEKGKRQ